MNITLIEVIPESYNVYSAFYIPRLGLPLLGAILKQKGHNVKIIAKKEKDITQDDFASSFVVGISTTTSTAPAGYRISNMIKKQNIITVIGGPHSTFLPEEALNFCDFVVRGEGEVSFPKLINAIEEKDEKKLEEIPGISFIKDGKVVNNPQGDFIPDLDENPYPDFKLIKNIKSINPVPVQTSRGCPFGCKFCSVTSMFGRKYRFRSKENIISELKLYPHKGIFFCDDNFCADKKRTKELLSSIIDQGINLPYWSAQTRVDVAKDEELLSLFKKTKCFRLYIGFESVNQKTLTSFNKCQSVEDIEYCISVLKKYKIKIHGMFIFGSDNDDKKTFQDTVKFAKKNKIDSVQFLSLVPIPGSEIAMQMQKEKRIISYNWNLYDGHYVTILPKRLTPYQLQVGIIKAMRQFYTIPRAIKALLRGDYINAALNLLAIWFINKGKKYYKDYIKELKKRHFEDSVLKIKIIEVVEKRFAQIELSGILDKSTFSSVKKRISHLIKDKKTSIIVNLQNLEEITSDAKEKLYKRIEKLTKQGINIKITNEEKKA